MMIPLMKLLTHMRGPNMHDHDDQLASLERAAALMFDSIRESLLTDGLSFDEAFRKRLAALPVEDQVQAIFDVACVGAATIQGHSVMQGATALYARLYAVRQFELGWQRVAAHLKAARDAR